MGVVQKLASSPVTVRARTSVVPPPSPRKPAARRTPAQRPTTLPTNKGRTILMIYKNKIKTRSRGFESRHVLVSFFIESLDFQSHRGMRDRLT